MDSGREDAVVNLNKKNHLFTHIKTSVKQELLIIWLVSSRGSVELMCKKERERKSGIVEERGREQQQQCMHKMLHIQYQRTATVSVSLNHMGACQLKQNSPRSVLTRGFKRG